MFRHHKHFGANFDVRISSVLKNCTDGVAEIKIFVNKFNTYVSSLLLSLLHAVVILQKYFGITVISSQVLLFAPSLVMQRCHCVPNKSPSVYGFVASLPARVFVIV